jgi:hypothetical protein
MIEAGAEVMETVANDDAPSVGERGAGFGDSDILRMVRIRVLRHGVMLTLDEGINRVVERADVLLCPREFQVDGFNAMVCHEVQSGRERQEANTEIASAVEVTSQVTILRERRSQSAL